MYQLKTSIRIILCIAGSVLFTSRSIAQSPWQTRYALSISAPVSEKLELAYGHMRAYNATNKFENIFNQHALQLDYEHNRQWKFSGAVQFITPSSTADTRIRIFAGAAHTIRFDKLNWTNAVRLETNSKNETRFRHRFGISTRVSLRKRLEFLQMMPSISYAMFYNIGGNPIRYYDEEANLLARQTPDGFHRGRLTLSLNSKINNYLRVTVYYMRQQEFNLFSSPTKKMNVYDPVRNRTLRPFNNFNALGLSLNVSLEDLIK